MDAVTTENSLTLELRYKGNFKIKFKFKLLKPRDLMKGFHGAEIQTLRKIHCSTGTVSLSPEK